MTSVNGVDKALEEPEGMETEAHLLKDLAQIPAISSAWVGKTSYEGNQVTVSTRAYYEQAVCEERPFPSSY